MKFKINHKLVSGLAIALILNLSAIAKQADLNYLRDGISFSLPATWKVIANDSIENNAYYFSAEATGSKATGLITVVWINEIKNTDETMILHQKSMKSSNIYRNPGIEFTEIRSETFAGIPARSCQYTTLVDGRRLDGVIYCFNKSGKTITIFMQNGYNDLKRNQKAFTLFRQTFNCRD